MAGFTGRELDTIGAADEVQISSRRSNGTLRPFVTIWAVREGGDIYVRSANGATTGWFGRAVAKGQGSIRAAGVERRVRFERAIDQPTQERIDAAYHLKYDRYGVGMVGPVVGPGVWGVTLRVLPD